MMHAMVVSVLFEVMSLLRTSGSMLNYRWIRMWKLQKFHHLRKRMTAPREQLPDGKHWAVKDGEASKLHPESP